MLSFYTIIQQALGSGRKYIKRKTERKKYRILDYIFSEIKVQFSDKKKKEKRWGGQFIHKDNSGGPPYSMWDVAGIGKLVVECLHYMITLDNISTCMLESISEVAI